MLTVERLKEVLRYEPETGFWFWLVNRMSGVKAGDRAGYLSDGTWRLCVDGRRYHSNRLIWLYMTGTWPPEHVDHENTDRLDDRWLNLRLASHSENQANRKVFRNNLLGMKGVKRVRRTNRFQARIYFGGKSHHLGCFDTPEEANDAYRIAAERVHREFARAA